MFPEFSNSVKFLIRVYFIDIDPFEFNNNFMDTPLHLDFIHLFQFGELGMSRKMEILLHNQVCHEISYVVSGSGFMYSDDKAFPISRGDVHVISKGSDHRIVADKEQGLHFIYLGFMLEQYPGMEDIIEFYSKSPSTIVRDESSLNFILEQLIDEMYNADKYHKIVLEMGIKQILERGVRTYSWTVFNCRLPCKFGWNILFPYEIICLDK